MHGFLCGKAAFLLCFWRVIRRAAEGRERRLLRAVCHALVCSVLPRLARLNAKCPGGGGGRTGPPDGPDAKPAAVPAAPNGRKAPPADHPPGASACTVRFLFMRCRIEKLLIFFPAVRTAGRVSAALERSASAATRGPREEEASNGWFLGCGAERRFFGG